MIGAHTSAILRAAFDHKRAVDHRRLLQTLHNLQAEAMRQRASHTQPRRTAVQRPLWEVSR